MNDEDDYLIYGSNGLPPILVGIRVRTAHRQRIIEHKLCRLEIETMLPLVSLILRLVPCLSQLWPRTFYVTTYL